MPKALLWIFFAVAILQAQDTQFLPGFKIAVRTAPNAPAVGDLIRDQIKDDIELILRRNGVPVVSEENGQYFQVSYSVVSSEDHRLTAINVKAEVVAVGFTFPAVMKCYQSKQPPFSSTSAKEGCWYGVHQLVGIWNEERLLLVSLRWPDEVRKCIRDLTESFALYYLRKKQKTE